MRIIIMGTGTVGSAVGKVLKELGHEVISVGRKSGDQQASCIFHGLYAGAGAEVAFAYFRAISHPITGRILKLHKTGN